MQGAEARAPPPVNNLLQPDVYNKLDAQARERTRVVNSQLAQRLTAQQHVLAKYRLAAERCYRREKSRVAKELDRISNRLPAVSRIPDFRNKFLYGEGLKRSQSQSLLDVRPKNKKIRGVPEEKPEEPFCRRFFLHHLPTKSKYYNSPAPLPNTSHLPAKRATAGQDGMDTSNRVELPPLATNELPSLITGNQDATDTTRLSPIENHTTDQTGGSYPKGGDYLLSSRSDGVISQRVVTGSGSERALIKEEEEGRQPERARTLPPLSSPSLRLAHSSPQLCLN